MSSPPMRQSNGLPLRASLNPRSNSSVLMMLLTVKGTVLTCGKRGADVRPDFNWSKQPVEMMGYR